MLRSNVVRAFRSKQVHYLTIAARAVSNSQGNVMPTKVNN